MKRLAGLAVAAIGMGLLTGCIRSTRVEVRQTGASQEVDLTRRWHGLTVGPCGFAAGSYAKYSLRLNGPGPSYPIQQIEVLNEKGAVDEYVTKGLTGEVRIDSTRHIVKIHLRRGEHPFEINGSYKYRER